MSRSTLFLIVLLLLLVGGAFYLSGDGGLILRYDLTSHQFSRESTPGPERIYGT